MSDFLSRIAARAVGEPPAARPKLPALFAAAESSDAPALEVVAEDEIVSRPPSLRQGDAVAPPAHGIPLADLGPPEAPAEPAARVPATDEDEERSAVAARARPARPDAADEEPPRPARRAPAPGSDAAELRTTSRAPSPVPDPPPLRASRPAPVVAAVPVWARLIDPAPRAPAATAAAPPREEPAPVRVHIGRLEVRASLQQAPRVERPPREPTPSPELSLADYLRGKREAG